MQILILICLSNTIKTTVNNTHIIMKITLNMKYTKPKSHNLRLKLTWLVQEDLVHEFKVWLQLDMHQTLTCSEHYQYGWIIFLIEPAKHLEQMQLCVIRWNVKDISVSHIQHQKMNQTQLEGSSDKEKENSTENSTDWITLTWFASSYGGTTIFFIVMITYRKRRPCSLNLRIHIREYRSFIGFLRIHH